MISPEEIKNQALNWWKLFLQSVIAGEMFFPRTIGRIGKVKPSKITGNFEVLQQEIEQLYRHSKNQTGTGYQVITASHSFRRTGQQELPDSIVLETIEDYISFIQKKKEWKTFLQNYEHLITTIPSLKEWAWQNCLWLTDPGINWFDVLKVCRYFISTPRPHLYLRQLPIEVHTKFIENNVALIQSLLHFLIPDHIRSADQKHFAERFFLKYDEPLIRIRILDQSKYAGKLSDISIPISDFEHTDFLVERVLIAENKMTFLTLPPLPSTIAIWSGGGFNISYLKDQQWLYGKKIFYWGDIDEHGFQILHQLRNYYKNAESMLMDKQTFEHFREFAVDGPRSKSQNLPLLNEEETHLYKHLKTLVVKNRLEQEKISQYYIEEFFRQKFSPSKPS
jgi:hypothetical protein